MNIVESFEFTESWKDCMHSYGCYFLSLTIWTAPFMAAKKMRWCAVSDPEQRKCAELAKALAAVVSPATLAAFARLSCIRASSTTDCINRIKVSKSTMQYTIKRRFNPAWSKLFKVACISVTRVMSRDVVKLIHLTMKIWKRAVKARIRTEVMISEQQFGFMLRKSTTDVMCALRVLMEKYGKMEGVALVFMEITW